jgi:histidinol-phosphatase (PHP family)
VGEQYPSVGFLDRLIAQGVTFTTASDAHSLERVGERAGDLAELLEARGVTQLASFSNRRRELVPIRSI